jgi:hypothetical protein
MNKKITRIEIQNLAVCFRINSSSLRHTETWDLIGSLGGAIAIHYGRWLEMPERNKTKRRELQNQLAWLLDIAAMANQ